MAVESFYHVPSPPQNHSTTILYYESALQSHCTIISPGLELSSKPGVASPPSNTCQSVSFDISLPK